MMTCRKNSLGERRISGRAIRISELNPTKCHRVLRIKIGSIFIHSAPPSMHPMDVQSTRRREISEVKKYIDRRVTVEDTASKSTLHRKKHTVYLHPFPQRKNIEHLECYLHHQCKIPRRRCVWHPQQPDRKRRLYGHASDSVHIKRIPQRSLHHQLCELDKVLLLE